MADKIVDFYKYCKQCMYYDYDADEEPCTKCLESPVNQDSHKPVLFKEKEEEQ